MLLCVAGLTWSTREDLRGNMLLLLLFCCFVVGFVDETQDHVCSVSGE